MRARTTNRSETVADLVGIAPGYTAAGTSLSRDAFTTALMVRADMINGWKADFEYFVTASSLGVEGQRIRVIGGYRF